MTTKITLELDESLLQKAERWAQQEQLSLSDAISSFLRQLPEADAIAQEDAGILSNSETGELQQAISLLFETLRERHSFTYRGI